MAGGPDSKARRLLAETVPQVAASVTAWHPAVISGRRVGFAGELLATIRQIAGEIGGATTASAETAATLLAGDRLRSEGRRVGKERVSKCRTRRWAVA